MSKHFTAVVKYFGHGITVITHLWFLFENVKKKIIQNICLIISVVMKANGEYE